MITTTGSTFTPVVEVAQQNVTVTWSWAGGSTTGLSPSINFGSSATRTVSMNATVAGGYSALSQITVFNIGFSHLDDPGRNSLPSSYDLTPQLVSGISNVSSMSGLVYFLAADIPGLIGPVDFSNMTSLLNIECYGSSFSTATIRGCASLVRCVIEANNLSSFDPSPAASTLQELRLAFQQSGKLAFPASLPSFPAIYHWCVRDQTVTNMPSFAAGFPELIQLWIWNTGQTGTLQTNSMVPMDSILAHNNSYTGLNIAGQFPYTFGQLTGVVAMGSNALTSVTITGCGLVYSWDFSVNSLSQSQVDSILTTINGFNTTDSLGVINVSGAGNSAPSAIGAAAVTALEGRSWTVTTN